MYAAQYEYVHARLFWPTLVSSQPQEECITWGTYDARMHSIHLHMIFLSVESLRCWHDYRRLGMVWGLWATVLVFLSVSSSSLLP